MLRHVESRVARFSEGLPKEADDANMATPVAEVEVFRAEFVLPAASKVEEAKPEESDPNKAAAASEGEGMMDCGDGPENGEDGAGTSGAMAAAQVRCCLIFGVTFSRNFVFLG